ncbi:tripartite tricarboxylate transporter substrate-binding protein [Microvirga antarctica]|uniref:Bug family tripartite tricarboxylate transporter substrate binding protein n=1 Tax=Microvirga antarctica TaxID=2819233 RepID=UPI001B31541F
MMATLMIGANRVQAADYEIMAPAAPGGGYDRTSRAVEQVLKQDKLGTATVINVGGAGGAIGLAQFIRNRSGSDNAMIVGGFGMIASFATNKSKVTLADVTPIARLMSEYSVVVVPKDSPIKTLADLVAQLKKNTNGVSWAGGSAGGTDHILAGSIAKAIGVDPKQVNYVAFSGGGDSLAAIIGGQVTVGVGGFSELADQIKAGNLRVLAISSDKRVPGVDIPTLKEQGVDASLSNWRGIAAPPGITPAQRQAYLDLIAKVVASKSWKDILQTNGWNDEYLAGDDFKTYIANETTRITEILTQLGLVK